MITGNIHIDTAILLVGILTYSIIASAFYVNAWREVEYYGSISKVPWTYLYLIGFIITLPLSVAVVCAAIPFVAVFALAALIAWVTKAHRWIDPMENFFKKVSHKIGTWWERNSLVKKLSKPIRKEVSK